MDQRGIDDQRRGAARTDEAYLTSAEAIALLEVKKETLYAYASRGLVRSVPGPRGRPRLYARADVERLRARHDARAGHAAVAADALRWGEPVLDSAITEITARGPRTRGVLLVEAAEAGASMEEVAERAWASGTGSGTAHASWALEAEPLDRARRALRAASQSLRAGRRSRDAASPEPRILDRLVVTTALFGVRDPSRFVLTREAELVRARGLIRVLASALALPDLERAQALLEAQGPVAAQVLGALGLRDDRPSRRAIDAVLVVLADHELNASTFAARVAASAGADLHACLLAGLAAVSGPRHGGACDRVEALVTEAGSPARAAAALAARLARGEGPAGFGHPLYPEGDPRGEVLLGIARSLVRDRRRPASGRARARTLLALVDHARQSGGELPSVDAGSVAITAALAAPPGTATALFALGRVVGWVAHVLEQRESGALLRPRARFVG